MRLSSSFLVSVPLVAVQCLLLVQPCDSWTVPNVAAPAALSLMVPTTNPWARPDPHPHGIGQQLRLSPLHAFTIISQNDDSGNGEDDKTATAIRQGQQDALTSIRRCYSIVFVSAVLDAFLDRPAAVERSYAALANLWRVASVAWKIGFAVNLARAASIWTQLDEKRGGSTFDKQSFSVIVNKSYGTLAPLWRRSALYLLLDALANIIGSAKQAGMAIANEQELIIGSVATLLGLFFLISRKDGKVSTSRSTTRKVHVILRNMGLCVGALVLRASVVTGLTVRSANTSKPLVAVFALSGLPTPFVTAGLLRRLRNSLDQTFRSILSTTEDADETRERELEIYESQSNFYGKVAATFQLEVSVKMAVTIAAFVRKLMS